MSTVTWNYRGNLRIRFLSQLSQSQSLLVNPFPTPGIRLGAVHGRQEASGDAQAAPVGLWKRSPASRTRLSVPYNPY